MGAFFRCGGDWIFGKGSMGCWLIRVRWAFSGFLESGLVGDTEA